MVKEYDFSGWATRNDVLCSDGRIIRKDAFQHNDGAKVPLMWGHQHNDPLRVLGHGILENREEGVYVYGKFNDSESGQAAKYAVEHGDVTALSIYANQLKQNGRDVMHGNIREVSLVVAGANPSAYIENVVRHSDDSEEDIIVHEEAVIYTGESIVLSHSEETVEHAEKEDESVAEETKKENTENGKTVKDVFDEMTEEQKTVVYAMIGMALEENGVEADDDEEKVEHSEGGTETMKINVFDQADVKDTAILTHADQEAIMELAKKPGVGSFKQAVALYAEEQGTMAHGLDLGNTETLEELLPDHKLLNPGAPEVLRDDQGWVMGVINKIKKSPYPRIRTRYADARVADLKAKGYNNRSEEKALAEKINMIGRKTEPTTIYIKEELHRDDINDITDFDMVAFTHSEMKVNMMETIALSALVGDGRKTGDPDKINELNIRPIWKDDEMYTIHHTVDIEGMKTKLQGTNTNANFGEEYIYAEAMVAAALFAREKYKGSGSLVYYCDPHSINVMLLARDLNGRRIYDSKADLAKALNVTSIVEIEKLAGLTRETDDGKTKKLLGLFVNLSDYQFGSAKGGEITNFSDFDIDFNKYKYLMETRLSGALVKLESAIALEEDVTEAAG